MPKKKKMLHFLLLLLVLLIPPSIFIIDYNMALKEMPPIFAIRTQLYKDGGTSIYKGLGYQVTDYNQLDGRKDVVFKSIFVSKVGFLDDESYYKGLLKEVEDKIDSLFPQ
jgi:hypothetical protein